MDWRDSVSSHRIALVGIGGAVLSGSLLFGGNAPSAGQFALTTGIALLGGLIILWGMALKSRLAPVCRNLIVAILIGASLVGASLFVRTGFTAVANPVAGCRDDTALATVSGGALIRQGKNPYTSFDEIRQWLQDCGPDVGGTPLQGGRFANLTTSPSPSAIHQAAEDALLTGNADEIERGEFYPAGALLMGLAGERGLAILTVLSLVLAIAYITKRANSSLRVVTFLALLMQIPAWAAIDSGHAEAVIIGAIAVAWVKPDTVLSAALLGLACATKQTAWFIAPAFLAETFRLGGWPAMWRALATISAVFSAINLPFAILDPGAWMHAVLSPFVVPAFPQGDGLVALITSHALPFALAFAVRILPIVVVGASVLVALADRTWGWTAPLIASLALWLGPRSLPQYFVGLGLLSVALVVGKLRVPIEPASIAGPIRSGQLATAPANTNRGIK